MVPEFGLGDLKYRYTQDDLQETERTMRRADRNGDGFIDRDEARRAPWTHRDPFEMDLNKDDRLDRMELTQRYARRRLLRGAATELVRKAWRSGNGIRPSGRGDDDDRRRRDNDRYRRDSTYWLPATILGRFDQNRNGRLEAEEAAQLGMPTSLIDVDRDGELSRDELHGFMRELQDEAQSVAEGLPAWFYEADANRDGQVAVSEFTDEWTDEKFAQFKQLDADGDGLLTTAEVAASIGAVGGAFRNEKAEVLAPRRTVISEIEVEEDFTIGDLDVQLSITHTYVSQLDAYLTGPDGQRIELFAAIGGSNDHFNKTIFDDQAREAIYKARAPYEGRFLTTGATKRQPSLGHFKGKSVKGVWQLVIRGTRSERFGMLHGWSLLVKPQEDDGVAVPEEGSADGETGVTSPPTGATTVENQARATTLAMIASRSA